MSLKYAILGLLSLKPQSGYELKANFDQSIQYLWNADQAQIYRTLTEIAKEGWVISQTIQQDGRPNKKVYELTKDGEKELQRWLSFPLQPREQRNAELVQVFFSGQLFDEDILCNLRRLKENIQAGLSCLSSLEKSSDLFDLENKLSRNHFFFNATLRLGIRTAQINLEWVDEMIKKIENGGLPPV